ncbi:MAG TPA: polyprenyl synthetase family protein [Dehalococcoidia bacterium]|nr:polyprenyl synthetase family protein [Dehalococcoidia bacterium]
MTAVLPPLDPARVAAVLSRHRDPVLSAMRAALELPGISHVALMRYHLGWADAVGAPLSPAGGKMLRPALCMLACEAVGGDPSRAVAAAAALELVHNFTLIHDDIEDASDTRHGRQTLWRVAGIPQAINAGDGMFVLARRTLLAMADAGVPDRRVLDAARLLDDACVLLCEGQYADIGFETRAEVTLPQYEAMIAGKTAALLGASAAIGALAGDADVATVTAFGECGRLLGFAFQIQDDVLGIWGEGAVTGKPVADDIRSRKKSFPIVYAFDHLPADERATLQRIYTAASVAESDVTRVLALLDEAGARAAATAAAARWAAAAIAAVRPLPLAPAPRTDLEALASFLVYRQA